MLSNPEMFVAVMSGVVAFSSLAVSLYQIFTTKKHNYASVTPWLTMSEDHDEEDGIMRMSFTLHNVGIGPAIIKSFTLLHGDRTVSENNRQKYTEFAERLEDSFSDISLAWIAPNTPIAAGQECCLLAFEFKFADKALYKQAIDLANTLNVLIEYESVYGEKVFTCDSRDERQYH